MIMRNFSPTKYITQQKTAAHSVVGHYSLTICTNWLLKQWTKSCHTHTQSQAHGCCRIHTLQRPSIHTPGQLWENKSWYSSRWCSSSTDWQKLYEWERHFAQHLIHADMVWWCDGGVWHQWVSSHQHSSARLLAAWHGWDGATIMSWELRVMECEVTTTSAR